MQELERRLSQLAFMREGPFPVERKGEVFAVVNDIMNFAITHFDSLIIHHFDQLLRNIPDLEDPEQKMELKHHLFWWIVFCETLDTQHSTIYHEFITHHWHRFRKDETFLQLLFSWSFIQPGFYTVIDRHNPLELTLKDLTTGDIKPVTVYNESFRQPQIGDLLTGQLISYCDGTYSPIFSFLTIPKKEVTTATHLILATYKSSSFSSFSSFIDACYGQLLPKLYPFVQHK